MRRWLAAALSAAALAGAMLALPPAAFVARAQEPATSQAALPESRLAAFFEALGVPGGVFSWTGVRPDGDALLVQDFAVNLAAFSGAGTIPLGELRLWDIRIESGYVTAFRAGFSGIAIDLAALSETGQAMIASGAPDASGGMALVVIADGLIALGYKDIAGSLSYETRTDLAGGVADDTLTLQMPGLFDVAIRARMTGVTPAYLDWERTNLIKLYLDNSPEAAEEIDRRMATEEGPYSGVGLSTFALDFDDQGLMPRLEPQMAALRPMMLGVGPDGVARTALSDQDLRELAALMGRGVLPAEKLLPVITALYRFVMAPDVLKLAVTAEPAVGLAEIARMGLPDGGALPDIAARLTFEASNMP